MKKIGLLAFGITTCVLVPTTLHVLQAGPNQVAKLVAPDMTSIQVGDAKVDIVTDKAIVEAGGKMHVTITATSDKREKVTLAVLVYEAEGMGEGRTEAPPNRVGRDEVTLDTKDGKATKTFAFTLPGNRPGTMDGVQEFGHYTVLVMAPKLADDLEARRRKTTDSGNDPKQFFAVYSNISHGATDLADGPETDYQLGKVGQIARLDVNTLSVSDHLKILASDTGHADDSIPVKVRVTNPTKRDFASVDVTLKTQPDSLGGTWTGIAPESVEIAEDGTQTVALKAHETKDVVFHVKTSEQGTLGLYATVACSGDACSNGDDYATVMMLNDSTIDGIDIMPAIEKPADDTPAAQQAQADATAPAIAAAQKPADDNATKDAAKDAADAKAKALAKDPWAVALEPKYDPATTATKPQGKPEQTAQTTAKNPEIK